MIIVSYDFGSQKPQMLTEWVQASKWQDERSSQYSSCTSEDAISSLNRISLTRADTTSSFEGEPQSSYGIGKHLLKAVGRGRLKKPYTDLISYWRHDRKNRESLVKILDELFFRLTFSRFETKKAWFLIEFAKYFVVTLSQDDIGEFFRPVLSESLETYEERWEEINPKLAARLARFGSLIEPNSDSWRASRYTMIGQCVNSALSEKLEMPHQVILIIAEYTLEQDSLMVGFE